MPFLDTPNRLLAVAFAVAFLYWDLRERFSPRARRGLAGHLPAIRRAIRLLMPLLALLLILQLVEIPLPEASKVARGLAPSLQILGYVLAWSGLALAVWAREVLGRHWVHAADYQVLPGQALVTSGPYRFVRHPIYLGLWLAFLGGELAAASWLALLALPLLWLFVWQARKEDILLARSFGEQYRAYRARTGLLLPRRYPRA